MGGVDHNAYIGPYVRVTETVEKKKIDRCEGHNFPDDAQYCPKCGTARVNRYAEHTFTTPIRLRKVQGATHSLSALQTVALL